MTDGDGEIPDFGALVYPLSTRQREAGPPAGLELRRAREVDCLMSGWSGATDEAAVPHTSSQVR